MFPPPVTPIQPPPTCTGHILFHPDGWPLMHEKKPIIGHIGGITGREKCPVCRLDGNRRKGTT